MLTGLSPDNIRVWDLKTKFREHAPNVITLPQYFRQQGYTTQAIGKVFDHRNVDAEHDKPSWSIKYQTPNTNTEFQYAAPEHYAAMKALQEAGKLNENPIRTLRKSGLTPPTEAADAPAERYPDAQIATLGVSAINRLSNADAPFFLAVGFLRPHLPFAAPKKYWDMYDASQFELPTTDALPTGSPEFAFQDSWELRWAYSDVPNYGVPLPDQQARELIHGYYACVTFIDDQIGKLLDELDDVGLRDNTIVVLWGDHGWHLGDHGMWCKHTNFEQATRSPLIFAGPGIPKDEQTSEPVELIDVYPTLCALSDLPISKKLDGISLLPLFNHPDTPLHFAAQSQFPRDHKDSKLMGYSYRTARYRYTEWRSIDTGDVVASELYDYETDPLEQANLIDHHDYAPVIAEFTRYLSARESSAPISPSLSE